MKLAKISQENEVLTFPCSILHLRKEFPTTSFPSPLTQEDLVSTGYVIVKETKPDVNYDETLYDLVSNAEFINDEWIEMWYTEAVSAEETTRRVEEKYLTMDYRGFWKAFVRSNSYAALKAAAASDLSANVLATELISVFSDAKSNNLDIESMQVGIGEALAALSAVDPALEAETEALLTAHGMDAYLAS